MTRLQCIVCGESTEDAPGDSYLEISVRLPDLEDPSVQWYGAHRGCFDASVAVNYQTAGEAIDYEAPPPEPQIIAVPRYEPEHGIQARPHGGRMQAECSAAGIVLSADVEGLRDLARWLLAVSDRDVPSHSVLKLNPGEVPLSEQSAAVTIARASMADFM